MFIEIINLLDKIAEISAIVALTMLPMSAILLDRKQKIQLKKLSPYNGKIIVSKNFILNKMDSLEMQRLEFTKKRILKPYILELCRYVHLEDLKIISNNIKTVSIKRKPLLFLSYGIGVEGVYISEENTILISSKDALGHEFLHFASTIYDPKTDTTLSGFYHSRNHSWLGHGINEGYTELLASRIYQNGDVAGYDILVKIVKMIEMFFHDQRDMAHLYFSCNLPGLVEYLGQYISTKEALKLIFDLDYIDVSYRSTMFPFGFIRAVQVQMKLYNWFKVNCKDQAKIKKFEHLACESKIVSLLIKRKKWKLYRKPSVAFTAKSIPTPKKKPNINKIASLQLQKAILETEKEQWKNDDKKSQKKV